VPERYAQANPSELLPLRVPVRLVQGALDTIVRPEQSQRFAAKARAHGDDARVVMIDAAGHFDVIAPFDVQPSRRSAPRRRGAGARISARWNQREGGKWSRRRGLKSEELGKQSPSFEWGPVVR
jgi:acetyl esterase/lipase